MPSFAGMALSCSSLEDFVPCTLLLLLAMGTTSLVLIPFLIFAPFEESSSSYPHHVEGFFLELPSHMPTLSWGVLWSASFTQLRFFGSCPWLYRGLLPGASLRMPTLSWGVQWSACLSGLHCATFFLPLLSWASSWVIIRLILLSSMLQSVGAFFRMHFLQALSSSRPGFWLSPEGSVFSPSLLAFSRIRFILCRFLFGALFC